MTLRQWSLRYIPSWLHPHLRMLQFRATLALGALLRRLPGSSRRFGPPRGFALTLPRYVARRNLEAPGSALYREIYPAHRLQRSPPRTLEPSIHPAFQEESDRFYPAAGVAVIERGRVLTATGAVIAPGDELLCDVSDTALHEDPLTHPIYLSLKLPRVTSIGGTVAVATTYRSGIYYHWLLDTLPRLHLLEKAGLAYDKIVLSPAAGYQRQSIELLGIDRARLITAADGHIEATRLLVPSLPGAITHPPAWACQFLRESFLPHAARDPTPPRVFVSRARTGTRRILNEDEIALMLGQYGFERVFLEDMPFPRQVRLFSRAEIIVSAHGSGLANILFCRPGTSVVEILGRNYVNTTYWGLSEQLGLVYYYLLGANKENRALPRGRVHEDLKVDTAELGRLIAGLDRRLTA
jgi:capsular polysaccharide biosynthesis protein